LTTNIKKSENSLSEFFTGSNGIVSALVVVLGFLFATLLLLAIGRKPAGMYQAIVQVITGFDSRRGTWNVRYTGEWLVNSVPLILCALSMGFAARSGLFNIGAEGQYIAGLTAAQIVAVKFVQVPVLHWAAALAAGIIAAAAWGGIAGFLKARYKVSEVVSTIMMNYIALYVHRIITMRLPGSNTFRTPDFPVTASISSSLLSSITNGSRLNYGLWFTAAAVFIYWIVMEKTVLGYSLRASGYNKEAALYAGIRVNLNNVIVMAIVGSFAGLAGGCAALGAFTHGRVLVTFDNYGFDAIAVALGGNCTASGITVMGLLFGMLRSSQPLMQSRQIPGEIASIIIGLVVVFISLRAGIRLLTEWKMRRKTFNTAKRKYS
jgi:simple sugar transport system permease protein